MDEKHKAHFKEKDQEPEIEINKSSDYGNIFGKFFKDPKNITWYYLIFLLLSFWLWPAWEQNKITIPYSQFEQYLQDDKVHEVLITENYVRGLLKEQDPQTQKPKAFVTALPANTELASDLVKHKVKVIAAHESKWLNNLLFNWILPFSLIFLLWGWFAKRMGNMGGSFLSIGNKVRIHPENAEKVTFADVAGEDEAKDELQEVIQFLTEVS